MRFILTSRAIYIGFAILLYGCATTKTYNDFANWQGRNIASLVKRWGTPDTKIISPDGDTVYFYKLQTSRTYRSQASPAIGVHVSSSGRPVIITPQNNVWDQRTTLSLTCTITFETNQQGIITHIQAQGNGCSSHYQH